MAGLANSTSPRVNDGVSDILTFTKNLDLIAYVVVGTLGAISWDVFSNLGDDYELVKRSPIGLPIVVYFLSRITTLFCFVFLARFNIAIDADCNTILRAGQWMFVFSQSLSTLLFVFRARAVYKNTKHVGNVFCAMWLGVVIASLVETHLGIGTLAVRQEPTGRCVTVRPITPFIVATTGVPMANDLVIFCAITWRLVQNSTRDLTVRKGLMAALFGRHLPSFSRTLLRDGQAYFLISIVVSATTIGIFCFAPPTVEAYSALLAFLNIGVMHLMACKVYRKTRLGVHRPAIPGEAPSLGPMSFRLRVVPHPSAQGEGATSRSGTPTRVAMCASCGDAGGADLERQKIGDADAEEADGVDGKINYEL